MKEGLAAQTLAAAGIAAPDRIFEDDPAADAQEPAGGGSTDSVEVLAVVSEAVSLALELGHAVVGTGHLLRSLMTVVEFGRSELLDRFLNQRTTLLAELNRSWPG
ncbi:MAG: Clp protease N-terminal domain-containing protein [Actinomycetota bacterium]